jgi:integrase
MFVLAGKTTNEADGLERQAVISALYLTGRRPSEIMMWTKNMFQWNADKLIITAPTLKVKDTGSFYDPDKPFIAMIPKDKTDPSYEYIKCLLKYVHALPFQNDRVFKKTARWMRKLVETLSLETLGRPFSPYHFRHSLLSFAADAGYSDRQLMAIKNSKSTQSVQCYVHNTTVELDYNRVNRNRFESKDAMPETKPQDAIPEQASQLPATVEEPATQQETAAIIIDNTNAESKPKEEKKPETEKKELEPRT